MSADDPGQDVEPAERGSARGPTGHPGAGLVEGIGSLIGRLFAIGFGVVWLGGVGTMAAMMGREVLREVRKPLSYAPAQAVVTAYTPPSVERDGFGDSTRTDGVIDYSYTVGTGTFTGKHAQSATRARNEYAAALAGTKAPGEQLTAWYDPDRPQESTLEPVAEPFMLGFFIFLMPFLAIGVGMVYSGLTGKGGMAPVPRRLGRGRGLQVSMTGAGGYVVAYAAFSGVGAFSFFALCSVLPWRTGWAVGVVLLVAVIPLLTVVACRTVRRLKKSAEARRARASVQPQAQAAPAPAQRGTAFPAIPGIAPAPAPASPSGPRGPFKQTAVMAGVTLFWFKRTAVMVGITLFWCGLTGVFAGIVLSAILRHQYAQAHFARTEGEVLASKVKENPGDSDSGPTYEPRIRYAYTVGGRQYVSERYAYGSFSSSNYRYAESVVARHPQGAKVTVHYDPDRPGESVLHLEVPSIHYFLLLFLQPFLLVGLGLIGYTATLPHRLGKVRRFLEGPAQAPCEIPTWGLLRDEMGGLSIQGGSRLVKAAAGLVFGYGLTCFIAIFPLALLGLAETASPDLIGLVIAGAGVVGLVAGMIGLTRQPGRARLHIDPVLGRLTLTSPRRNVELALRDVSFWLVRFIRNPRPRSENAPAHAPLLAAETAAGQEVPIHVFGTDADGRAIAEKAAAVFGGLTRKPLRVVQEPPPDSAPAEGPMPSLSEAVGSARDAWRNSRQYSDLL